MANTVGELVRNVQDAHRQGMSEMLNNLNRGFAPTITNLFQSENRHVTLAEKRQVHMHDGRQVHMHDGRQVHMHDQREIHNPSSASADPNPPMALEPAAAEEIVPSKLKVSRKKGAKERSGPGAGKVGGRFDRRFQGGSECT